MSFTPNRLPFFLLVLFTLGACAEAELASHVVKKIPTPFEKPEPAPSRSKGYFKVGSPYKIAGQRYYPKESYSYVETGVASWYGPNFHGKQTANGEIFDQNELTAAHRTLQIPSLVRVTNLNNGRSLVVRVNDRGPFSKGRIIDLSKRSAELLGFKSKGVAKVRVEILPEESRRIAQMARQGQSTRGTEIALNEDRSRPYVSGPKPTTAVQSTNSVGAGEAFYVQAGSFSDAGNAMKVARNLSALSDTSVKESVVNGRVFHRVRVGPFVSSTRADAVLTELAQRGYPQAKIIVD